MTEINLTMLPYYDGLANGKLCIPKCLTCNEWHFYPRPFCPNCNSEILEWAAVSGKGTVYSFSNVFRAPSSAFESDVPYTIAIIKLKEGPHLMSRLTTSVETGSCIGKFVTLAIKKMNDCTLPFFELVRNGVGDG